MVKPEFEKETDLCADFIRRVPKEWTVYAETGGFDILLVRNEDGFQIGVEAKLKLNAKVVGQVAERIGSYYTAADGPDCRAVLVPHSAGNDLSYLCRLLGIEVIRVGGMTYKGFHPDLPRIENHWQERWWEFFPTKRLTLPDYIPDTIAGDKSPMMLTDWKIRAMKLAVLLDKTGHVTRADFKKINVSISRWIGNHSFAWLQPGKERGSFVRGSHFPDFLAQHPVNYKQIEADFDEWNPRKEEVAA